MKLENVFAFFAISIVLSLSATQAQAKMKCVAGTASGGPGVSSTTVVCWDDNIPNPWANAVPSSENDGGTSSGPVGAPVTVMLQTVKVNANSVKCKIKAKGANNYNNKEYIGFVYASPGGPRASQVVEGSALSVDLQGALQQLGLSPFQIIVMIHNHDLHTYGGGSSDGTDATSVRNRSPSVADWNAYDWLGSGGASNVFGQFIVGPDVELRYFDGTNRTDPVHGTPPAGNVVYGSCP